MVISRVKKNGILIKEITPIYRVQETLEGYLKRLSLSIFLLFIISCSQTNQIISKRETKPNRLPTSIKDFKPGFIGSDVGTIKYSALDKETFRNINGKGWVLLDGKSYPGSDWHTLTGTAKIPDAKGRFLRMLDHGSGRDPGRSEIGSAQSDSYGKHKHFISRVPKGGSQSNHLAGSTNKYGIESNYGRNNPYPNLLSSSGGSETRPKNIAVNIFIKINDD